MITKGKSGANTKTGLIFEGKTDLATFLNTQKDYRVSGGIVCFHDKEVAQIFKKHQLYKFLEKYGIDMRAKCVRTGPFQVKSIKEGEAS